LGWIPGRISYYDRDKDGFITYRIPTGTSEPQAVWFENDDVVWLAMPGKGLTSFNISNKEISEYTNQSGDPSKFVKRNSINAIVDDGETLLLCTSQGLWNFNKQTKSFFRPNCSPSDSALLYNRNIRKVFKERDHYWIWLDYALVKVSEDFTVAYTLDFDNVAMQFDLSKSFEHAAISAITGTIRVLSG
jgi:hypothetical protein